MTLLSDEDVSAIRAKLADGWNVSITATPGIEFAVCYAKGCLFLGLDTLRLVLDDSANEHTPVGFGAQKLEQD
jgi:hypothetical protein